MGLNEGVKVEAMKGSQVPAIYHNNERGRSTSNGRGDWGRDEGVGQASFKDGCWQGVSGFAMYGQLTPLAKS